MISMAAATSDRATGADAGSISGTDETAEPRLMVGVTSNAPDGKDAAMMASVPGARFSEVPKVRAIVSKPPFRLSWVGDDPVFKDCAIGLRGPKLFGSFNSIWIFEYPLFTACEVES